MAGMLQEPFLAYAAPSMARHLRYLAIIFAMFVGVCVLSFLPFEHPPVLSSMPTMGAPLGTQIFKNYRKQSIEFFSATEDAFQIAAARKILNQMKKALDSSDAELAEKGLAGFFKKSIADGVVGLVDPVNLGTELGTHVLNALLTYAESASGAKQSDADFQQDVLKTLHKIKYLAKAIKKDVDTIKNAQLSMFMVELTKGMQIFVDAQDELADGDLVGQDYLEMFGDTEGERDHAVSKLRESYTLLLDALEGKLVGHGIGQPLLEYIAEVHSEYCPEDLVGYGIYFKSIFLRASAAYCKLQRMRSLNCSITWNLARLPQFTAAVQKQTQRDFGMKKERLARCSFSDWPDDKNMQLLAYQDFGACGPCGDDFHKNWLGLSEVNTPLCPGGKAYLNYHDSYHWNSFFSFGICGSPADQNRCEYASISKYQCSLGGNLPWSAAKHACGASKHTDTGDVVKKVSDELTTLLGETDTYLKKVSNQYCSSIWDGLGGSHTGTFVDWIHVDVYKGERNFTPEAVSASTTPPSCKHHITVDLKRRAWPCQNFEYELRLIPFKLSKQ